MLRRSMFCYAPDTGADSGAVDGNGAQETPQAGADGAGLKDIMGGTGTGAEPSTKADEHGGAGKGAGEGSTNAQPAWMQQLTEDMRSDAELAKFSSLKDFANAYKELAKGADGKIKPPAAGAKPEEVAAFYEALGKPKTADGYTVKGADGSDAKEFKELAFAANLTDEQAQAVYGALEKQGKAMIENRAAELERQFKETDAALKKEFGVKYGEKMELLKRGMQTFAGPSITQKLQKAGLSFDSDIVHLFLRLGEMNSEGGTVMQGAAGGGYRTTAEGGSFTFKGL